MVTSSGAWRKVYVRIWDHKGFRTKLNEGEKLLALHLLTGDQTNKVGLYRFSPVTVDDQLNRAVCHDILDFS